MTSINYRLERPALNHVAESESKIHQEPVTPRYRKLERPTPNPAATPSELEPNIQQEPVTIAYTLIISIDRNHLDRHLTANSQPGHNYQVSELESNIQQEPVTIPHTSTIRIDRRRLDRHRLGFTNSQPGHNYQVAELEFNIQQEPVTTAHTLARRIDCCRHRLKFTNSQPGHNIFPANILAAPPEISPSTPSSPKSESEFDRNLSSPPMLHSR
ncbi:hypothetical protein BJ322DRAFT_1111766 [Thelephora terrestris]|uniref:Uncharacterized protein n=1 Tax=Thelephora terrestris TaxID=56493 RepID=A0A9P6HBC1_9AGAM|nr:hypothetical protein BJ322DRAFT_1111587 [Thelephora terrestris]KAF9781859.1 hypothetical protein BJ322DRAFT_1111766 [Thelephora terrestris]